MIDPIVSKLLELSRQAGDVPFERMTIEKARRSYSNRLGRLPPITSPMHIEDLLILGEGGDLLLRTYRPPNLVSGAPCTLYFHGGGWVVGSVVTHQRVCHRLAALTGSLVISVDYRLAPEHKFPAALDDALAAFSWVVANAHVLGIDPRRITVAGDSAGANLAAVLALSAARGDIPAIWSQVLAYPVLDLTFSQKSHASAGENIPLTTATMTWFRSHYLAEAQDIRDWRVSPLFAEDLAGLPPSLILTAGHDVLRDEGAAYAARIADSGGMVVHVHFANQIHGFLTMSDEVGASVTAIEMIAAHLRTGYLRKS